MTTFDRAVGKIRAAIAALIGLSVFLNLLVFVAPLYTMQVYDRVLTSRNVMTLVMISSIVLVLLLAYAALEHFRSRALVQVGLRFDQLMSQPAFSAALSSALQTRGSHHVQILRDVATLRDTISGGLLSTLMDAPWTPIYLIICFLLHPLLGAVALFGACAILVVALLNERATKAPLIEASARGIETADRVASSLRNAEVICALGMAEAIRAQWLWRHEEALRAQVLASERGGSFLAVAKFLRLALQCAVVGMGAYLAINQEITPGVLFAASLIMGRALAPIEGAVAQWRTAVSARAAYERLQQALAERPIEASKVRLPAPKGDLRVEELTVLAPGTRVALVKDASFALAGGEVAAIVGPTGSGKSSLARALVGAWPAARGAVRLDGSRLSDFPSDQLCDALGYLPQDVELFAGTVRDNIARFRPDAKDDAVVEAAVTAGAHDLIQNLPQGYQTEIGEDGAALSGGQRQRIGLARAVFGRPALVVLDEPNANLDADGERALGQAIGRLQSMGTTVAVITHRPNLLSRVDTVILMHEGQVKRIGSRDEMLPLLVGPKAVAHPRALSGATATERRASRATKAA